MGPKRAAWKRPPLPQIPGLKFLTIVLEEAQRIRDRGSQEEEAPREEELESKGPGIEGDETAKTESEANDEEQTFGWAWREALLERLTQMTREKHTTESEEQRS
jgi:hypothetical protein